MARSQRSCHWQCYIAQIPVFLPLCNTFYRKKKVFFQRPNCRKQQSKQIGHYCNGIKNIICNERVVQYGLASVTCKQASAETQCEERGGMTSLPSSSICSCFFTLSFLSKVLAHFLLLLNLCCTRQPVTGQACSSQA